LNALRVKGKEQAKQPIAAEDFSLRQEKKQAAPAATNIQNGKPKKKGARFGRTRYKKEEKKEGFRRSRNAILAPGEAPGHGQRGKRESTSTSFQGQNQRRNICGRSTSKPVLSERKGEVNPVLPTCGERKVPVLVLKEERPGRSGSTGVKKRKDSSQTPIHQKVKKEETLTMSVSIGGVALDRILGAERPFLLQKKKGGPLPLVRNRLPLERQKHRTKEKKKRDRANRPSEKKRKKEKKG